jgi:hypothetical protein
VALPLVTGLRAASRAEANSSSKEISATFFLSSLPGKIQFLPFYMMSGKFASRHHPVACYGNAERAKPFQFNGLPQFKEYVKETCNTSTMLPKAL